MKIYTRTGDTGDTAALSGRRLKKDNALIEAYGTLDELNSVLGLAAAFCKRKKTKAILSAAQKDVFEIGASLWKGDDLPSMGRDTKRLEGEIDSLEGRLKPLKHFILPSGTKEACLLHVARSACRRAERRLVSAKVEGARLAYLNRLSDLLFVLARFENAKKGVGEELWKGK